MIRSAAERTCSRSESNAANSRSGILAWRRVGAGIEHVGSAGDRCQWVVQLVGQRRCGDANSGESLEARDVIVRVLQPVVDLLLV